MILAAAALVAVTGLFDDLRTVHPGMRLLVEACAAGAAAAAGAHVQIFDNPLDYVITVVWIVVITNAFNLLDNMDAAAGSIATVIAGALAVTALIEGQRLVGGMAVIIAAACLAFLLYNWYPARIFMGDAGSLFLGFVLAVIALKLRTPVPQGASIVALVLLVGPAVFDTTLVVISRVSNGRRIFIGGTDHTSHRLMLLGVPRAGVTAILVGGTAISCTLGVLVAEGVVSPWLAAAGGGSCPRWRRWCTCCAWGCTATPLAVAVSWRSIRRGAAATGRPHRDRAGLRPGSSEPGCTSTPVRRTPTAGAADLAELRLAVGLLPPLDGAGEAVVERDLGSPIAGSRRPG